jgi:hypothetical protein
MRKETSNSVKKKRDQEEHEAPAKNTVCTHLDSHTAAAWRHDLPAPSVNTNFLYVHFSDANPPCPSSTQHCTYKSS